MNLIIGRIKKNNREKETQNQILAKRIDNLEDHKIKLFKALKDLG